MDVPVDSAPSFSFAAEFLQPEINKIPRRDRQARQIRGRLEIDSGNVVLIENVYSWFFFGPVYTGLKKSMPALPARHRFIGFFNFIFSTISGFQAVPRRTMD